MSTSYVSFTLAEDLREIFVNFGPWTVKGFEAFVASVREAAKDDAAIDVTDVLCRTLTVTSPLFPLEELVELKRLIDLGAFGSPTGYLARSLLTRRPEELRDLPVRSRPEASRPEDMDVRDILEELSVVLDDLREPSAELRAKAIELLKLAAAALGAQGSEGSEDMDEGSDSD